MSPSHNCARCTHWLRDPKGLALHFYSGYPMTMPLYYVWPFEGKAALGMEGLTLQEEGRRYGIVIHERNARSVCRGILLSLSQYSRSISSRGSPLAYYAWRAGAS